MAIAVAQLNEVQHDLANAEAQCFDTLALHAGAVADPTTGALLTPIYQTTTYRQEAVGKDKGFTYSRSANPTVSALERRLAALEGADYCTCYATGLAATHRALSRVGPFSYKVFVRSQRRHRLCCDHKRPRTSPAVFFSTERRRRRSESI